MTELFFEHIHDGLESPPFQSGNIAVLNKHWGRFGGILGGRKYIIQSCKSHLGCESGWLVTIAEYKNELDSNWFKKVE